ncbi:hypothetical protein PHJA_001554200 [Phtheirospermum japonicum]|uniref:Small ribosomal subunit protein mS38 n=1 Tax=Phtheirospermum japonicum TaxID=374723 RepID=A0A830CAN7_9LAMI|nr:hypothetical protein PHJA_001554200 [Phtheirospermum japonicum]
MASPALQKLLRNQQSQSASKTLTYLRQPFSLARTSKPYDTTSFSNHPEIDYVKPIQSSCGHIYPTFPFGFFLDPISPTQLIRSEPHAETTPDESVIIRADSVKKKRKKKMNKHKLRKLRKRLRKKTKT